MTGRIVGRPGYVRGPPLARRWRMTDQRLRRAIRAGWVVGYVDDHGRTWVDADDVDRITHLLEEVRR